MRVFDASQHRLLYRAAARAEELTGGFYCIPGREWPRFLYDIATLADDPGPCRRVFADVVQVVRPAAVVAEPPRREMYRIRLRDDELLAAAEGSVRVALFPLLLYVLTHELVHVVRFASRLAAFDEDDGRERRVEEDRVHAITRRILQPNADPALRDVVDRCFLDS